MFTFKPAWWCQGGHAQTIAGTLLRGAPRLDFTRERIELPDGDFLDLDFFPKKSVTGKEKIPLVAILHGLEGSSQSPYVRTFVDELNRRGWNGVVMNQRMCSGEPNRLRQTYHSGKTEDLDYVVNYLREDKGHEELYLAGFSIGGNIALKWLGEQGENAVEKIRAAAAVSVPFDLAKTVERMDRGFNREIYTRALLSSLKFKARAKEIMFPGTICYATAKRCKTFKEFDHTITAPLNGFKSETEYWTKTSCFSFLKSIQIRTLLIHAENDPFFPARFIPRDCISTSQYFQMLVARDGGHLGFVGGPWPWRQARWLEKEIVDYFKAQKRAGSCL